MKKESWVCRDARAQPFAQATRNFVLHTRMLKAFRFLADIRDGEESQEEVICIVEAAAGAAILREVREERRVIAQRLAEIAALGDAVTMADQLDYLIKQLTHAGARTENREPRSRNQENENGDS